MDSSIPQPTGKLLSECQPVLVLGFTAAGHDRVGDGDNSNSESRTLGVFGVGPRCRPWPPAPPGDRFWQTLTFFRNPNVEPSSYPYTSTEWFSDMPTNFRLPPVHCSQWHKKIGYLDRLKWSR